MKKIFFLFSIIALAAACSSSDGETSTTNDGYDRKALLTHWANNIIIPSYTNYQVKLQTLTTDVNNFTATPTVATLATARASWVEAYKAFQYVAPFSFGKAEDIYFKEKSNTYPTDASGINANITAGTYDFTLISQFSKQGLPALDYVLNGLGTTDEAIVAFYTGASAANYKKYATDLVSNLKTNNDTVLNDWTGSYKNTYITNDGNTITSSVSITVNMFIKNFEKNVRAGKIGIPAGVFSGGKTLPASVEAFYKKDISKTLYTTAIQASQDFYNGKTFGSTATGPGLKAYLDFLKTVRSGQNLSDVINDQFTTIYAKVDLLNANFNTQITTDNSKMITAYDATQQNVVYMKLDMMQALKITVDYVDSDGD
ncbi:iron-regulated protein A precursor [Flavobacterium faecale]|uniref:Iron-regulated protein A n=1 Tax=Flavobacterium faecale TaxID=1355330 RepID=A0A2S1LHC7_9FLAO|nr:imelysin family protein [Flavobacterium faecale]AWG23108.1 iron-regulated protein A precursor [Flavobacterium faecale]